jgi:hypothetical protein
LKEEQSKRIFTYASDAGRPRGPQRKTVTRRMRLVTHCPDGDIPTPFGAVGINFCDQLLGETPER